MSESLLVRQDVESIAPVTASFNMKSTTPHYDATCTIEVYEDLGTVHIKWSLPLPYVFSSHPTEQAGVAITLFGDGVVASTQRTLARNDVWNTGKNWGTGWSAQLASWDHQSKAWVVQLRTPTTT